MLKILLKKYSGVVIIIISTLIPIFIWFPSLNNQFSWRNVSQMLALVGSVLLSINFILSGRFKFLEPLFNGLNRIYIIHHLVGEIALILLLFHPLFLVLYYIKLSLQASFDIIFPPLTSFATWFGMAALLTLITLIILTLYIKLPYNIWKLTHKFLGISLLLATIHIFFIESTVSKNLLLRYYILGFCILGIVSYLYRTIFGRLLVKRFSYQISQVKILGDITEVTMLPMAKKMNYLPGQFIFVKFDSLGVSKEEHPFSLTSSQNSDEIIISAKSVGNFTETMKLLKVRSISTIEGPFGAFSYLTKPRKKQIWIAGGIGITPFVSMAKSFSAENNYDVVLFYVVGVPEESVYLNFLTEISVKCPNFKIIPVFTKTEGRITAEVIAKKIIDTNKRDILVCGPPPMMKSLREQFNKIGIRNFHIFSEEFSIN